MATEKQLNGRITHKHDTEANWNKATGFIPKIGELIIYEEDGTSPIRFKIGNGEDVVIDLPFYGADPDYASKSYLTQ